jgi:hypothetical protein
MTVPSFLAWAMLVAVPADESTLALHYKPCRDLYETAKRESDPVLMLHVVDLCTIRNQVVEQ